MDTNYSDLQIPVESQSIPANFPKPKNKILLIAVILILVILLISGAYYLGLSSGKQSVNSLSRQSSISPSITTQPAMLSVSVSPVGISGWKVFENSDYKYSFSYPPQFTVTEEKT